VVFLEKWRAGVERQDRPGAGFGPIRPKDRRRQSDPASQDPDQAVGRKLKFSRDKFPTPESGLPGRRLEDRESRGPQTDVEV